MEELEVMSDIGSVLVGCGGSFKIAIPNGKGDGITKVKILDSLKELPFEISELDFLTTMEGNEIELYAKDCGVHNEIIASFSGYYHIYQYHGSIYFIKF